MTKQYGFTAVRSYLAYELYILPLLIQPNKQTKLIELNFQKMKKKMKMKMPGMKKAGSY